MKGGDFIENLLNYTSIEALSYPVLFTFFFFYTLKTNKEREKRHNDFITDILKSNTTAIQQNTETLLQLASNFSK